MVKFVELGRRILAWSAQHKAMSAIVIAVAVLIIPMHQAFALDLFNEFTQNPLDATALMLAGLIHNITALLGMVTLRLIEMIVIPILGYDGFYNSNITNLGWSLVRDVVNMFVVVVLLVIAIMTIVGYSAANWTQQLPRLFIAIVLVNFSKLICGFAIDVSQVIMFTFVNAIVSIAAGNFAAMLGITKFGQFSADFLDRVNMEGSGIEAYMYLGAAYLQFVMYLAILAVMFLLAVAFIWRIVILWVLIIMSPMAFFMIGIKDIFHTADGMFKNWQGKFVSALTFGPMLTFFLWLALAASSGSTLAQTEDFPMPDTVNDLNLPLEMFSLDNFLGMFLALAILLAGMQQASSAAKGMEGFASAAISEKMGLGIAKGLARPFNSSKRLGKAMLAGGKVGNTQVPGLANIAPNYTQKLGKMATGLGQKVGSAAGAGVLSRTVGNSLANAGGFVTGLGKDERKKRNKSGAEIAEHMTDAQKTAYNLARADAASDNPERRKRGNGVLATYTQNEVHGARMKDLVTKEKAQKALRKDLEDKYKKQFTADGLTGDARNSAVNKAVQEDFDRTMSQHLAMAQSEEGKAFMQLSSEEKDSIEDTMTANPHLIQPKDVQEPKRGDADYTQKKAQYDQKKQDAIRDHFQAMEDKKRLNVGAISAGAFGNDAVRQAMQSFKREGKDGKKVSLWSEIESGKGTIAQRKAVIGLISADDVRGGDYVKHVASLVRAGAVGDKDSDGNETRKEAVRGRVATTLPSTYGPTVYGKAASSLLDGTIDDNGVETGVNQESVLGASFATLNTSVGAETEQYQRASAVVEADAKSVRHLDSLISDDANSASEIATSRVNLEQVKKLRNAASENSDDGVRSAMALKTMEKAVHAEMNRPGIDTDRRKTLKRVADELGIGNRYASAGSGASSSAPASVASPVNDADASGAVAAAGAGAIAGAAASRIDPRLFTAQNANQAARTFQQTGGQAGAQARAQAAADAAARVANTPPPSGGITRIDSRYTTPPPPAPLPPVTAAPATPAVTPSRSSYDPTPSGYEVAPYFSDRSVPKDVRSRGVQSKLDERYAELDKIRGKIESGTATDGDAAQLTIMEEQVRALVGAKNSIDSED